MPSRWVPDTEGEQILLEDLAAGANVFAEFVVERVKAIETSLEKYHFYSKTKPRSVRYRDTIRQATYLNGALVGGTDVRGGARPKGDSIHSRVYTTSFLGHMLELTGAKRHDIPIPIAPGVFLVIDHPGFAARKHFVPGLLSAVSQVGAKMRGTVNARQSASGGGGGGRRSGRGGGRGRSRVVRTNPIVGQILDPIDIGVNITSGDQ